MGGFGDQKRHRHSESTAKRQRATAGRFSSMPVPVLKRTASMPVLRRALSMAEILMDGPAQAEANRLAAMLPEESVPLLSEMNPQGDISNRRYMANVLTLMPRTNRAAALSLLDPEDAAAALQEMSTECLLQSITTMPPRARAAVLVA